MSTYILGQGGFTKEIFEQMIVNSDCTDFAGFVSYDEGKLIANKKEITKSSSDKFILGTGIKKHRDMFISILSKQYPLGIKHFPNYFAATSRISQTSVMGYGNVFCEFSLVNANAVLGNFNCFNAYVSTHHDSVLGDDNVLSPYATLLGNVRIGNKNFFGAGATVVPLVSLGNNNTVSAGEYVFDDMENSELFRSGMIVKKK